VVGIVVIALIAFIVVRYMRNSDGAGYSGYKASSPSYEMAYGKRNPMF